MKKILALTLALCMLFTSMVGCSSGSDTTAAGTGSNTSTEAGTTQPDTGDAEASEEPTETNDDPTADLQVSEDAPTYVMVSKTLSDPVFIDMYIGFREFCESIGANCMYRGSD